jgi:hypothetical protein
MVLNPEAPRTHVASKRAPPCLPLYAQGPERSTRTHVAPANRLALMASILAQCSSTMRGHEV